MARPRPIRLGLYYIEVKNPKLQGLFQTNTHAAGLRDEVVARRVRVRSFLQCRDHAMAAAAHTLTFKSIHLISKSKGEKMTIWRPVLRGHLDRNPKLMRTIGQGPAA